MRGLLVLLLLLLLLPLRRQLVLLLDIRHPLMVVDVDVHQLWIPPLASTRRLRCAHVHARRTVYRSGFEQRFQIAVVPSGQEEQYRELAGVVLVDLLPDTWRVLHAPPPSLGSLCPSTSASARTAAAAAAAE